ncbi:hematopoietic cell signal transducer isoform X1 [Centroberyx affinis]|uniref:hematopoietic cell signal transducer isoform X1 n=1 Tax=Centroberyx affinis TaxID=166261 RepID=UPI003A5BE266
MIELSADYGRQKSVYGSPAFSLQLGHGRCSVSCYRIEPGTMAGIISADLVLTLIIVVVTYQCASSRRQRRENADKVYMNVRANCKT